METRAPKINRERTSRPRWSVPSRYFSLPPVCHAGGRKRSPSVPISGSDGAMTLANTAVKASTRRISVGRTGKPPTWKAAKRHARVRLAARLGLALGLSGALARSEERRGGNEDADE